MVLESALYSVNKKCLRVLDCINERLNTDEIVKKVNISRQMAYVYISVLRREGYIRKVPCQYEVTDNGKNLLNESANSNELVVDNP